MSYRSCLPSPGAEPEPGGASRYARQRSLPGVGIRGQAALSRARVLVHGPSHDAGVCAAYLAGAGVGELVVDPAHLDACRALNSSVVVEPFAEALLQTFAGDFPETMPPFRPEEDTLVVWVAGRAPRSFTPGGVDPVMRGAEAARWAMLEVLGPRA